MSPVALCNVLSALNKLVRVQCTRCPVVRCSVCVAMRVVVATKVRARRGAGALAGDYRASGPVQMRKASVIRLRPAACPFGAAIGSCCTVTVSSRSPPSQRLSHTGAQLRCCLVSSLHLTTTTSPQEAAHSGRRSSTTDLGFHGHKRQRQPGQANGLQRRAAFLTVCLLRDHGGPFPTGKRQGIPSV